MSYTKQDLKNALDAYSTALKKAEEIADYLGEGFDFKGPSYGMGGYYIPTPMTYENFVLWVSQQENPHNSTKNFIREILDEYERLDNEGKSNARFDITNYKIVTASRLKYDTECYGWQSSSSSC